jgi:hypothetical protein
MKKIIVVGSIITALIVVGIVFFACWKEKTNEQIQSEVQSKVQNFLKEVSTCCSASCRRGTCSVNQSPCTCTCVGGQPMCGSSNVPTSGRIEEVDISAGHMIFLDNAVQLEYYDNLIHYLQYDLSAIDAAKAIQDIKNLFVKNEWVLDSPETVSAYYKNMEIFVDFYNRQPLSIQDKIEDM